MSKFNDFYYIPSGITSEFCNLITKSFSEEHLIDSTIIVNTKDQTKNVETIESFNPKTRLSKNTWISTDHWIAGMMAHFINCANNSLFQYDLYQWSDKIQYTVYDGKNSHYAWHKDSAVSHYEYRQQDKQLIRKLSISLCLSSKNDYEGGEFQIMYGPKNMETIKLDIGDVIVFSSDASHRVRPLKSGKRISLVGWFAGPKFK